MSCEHFLFKLNYLREDTQTTNSNNKQNGKTNLFVEKTREKEVNSGCELWRWKVISMQSILWFGRIRFIWWSDLSTTTNTLAVYFAYCSTRPLIPFNISFACLLATFVDASNLFFPPFRFFYGYVLRTVRRYSLSRVLFVRYSKCHGLYGIVRQPFRKWWVEIAAFSSPSRDERHRRATHTQTSMALAMLWFIKHLDGRMGIFPIFASGHY